MAHNLSVRELQESDIPLITEYWLSADKDFLAGMGADITKIPAREYWHTALSQQLRDSYDTKKAYATIWLIDGAPVGHCNLFPIDYGNEAGMHLHMWQAGERKKGYGAQLVKMSLQLFFEKMKLKNLYCEPYALNVAPNKTLEKAGFDFIKKYDTIPGSFSWEQPVNRWEMSAEKLATLL